MRITDKAVGSDEKINQEENCKVTFYAFIYEKVHDFFFSLFDESLLLIYNFYATFHHPKSPLEYRCHHFQVCELV